MNKQKQASSVGVNLDVDTSQGGYTKDIGTKRTDKVCPRCLSRRINKVLRKCNQCKGRLLWAGDDIQPFIDRYEAFFIWYKPVMGIRGWYSSDYFIVNPGGSKY